ncbi:uncharacterized protein METZ01_LOCUS485059 [marine metagenome]|uniref:Uncharacterized protein n=1 Tax=marine metagenome TaxID=408172 RepID=A0A383CKC5_9ZZZZ
MTNYLLIITKYLLGKFVMEQTVLKK